MILWNLKNRLTGFDACGRRHTMSSLHNWLSHNLIEWAVASNSPLEWTAHLKQSASFRLGPLCLPPRGRVGRHRETLWLLAIHF